MRNRFVARWSFRWPFRPFFNILIFSTFEYKAGNHFGIRTSDALPKAPGEKTQSLKIKLAAFVWTLLTLSDFVLIMYFGRFCRAPFVDLLPTRLPCRRQGTRRPPECFAVALFEDDGRFAVEAPKCDENPLLIHTELQHRNECRSWFKAD